MKKDKPNLLSENDRVRIPVFWKAVIAISLVLFLDILTQIILYSFIYPGLDTDIDLPAFNELIRLLSFSYISNFTVVIILIAAFEIPRKTVKPRWWHLILMIIVGYPAGIAAYIIYNILSSGFSVLSGEQFSIFFGISYYPTILMLLLTYVIILYWENARIEHENALKAEALANEAKWQMLRYQVNPHFLFNSLNSIMALINEDKKLARSVVNELSSYFRHTLSWNGKTVITIDEELNAVKHYLYIQKIRFENRIQLSFNIDDDMRDFLIPVFGLQSLIENAIKYGIKTHEGVVNIRIRAYRDGEDNIISVSNSGKYYRHDMADSAERGEEGTRSGLENLKGRLDLLYPGNNSLSVYEDGGMVVAEIKINNKTTRKYEGLENHNS